MTQFFLALGVLLALRAPAAPVARRYEGFVRTSAFEDAYARSTRVGDCTWRVDFRFGAASPATVTLPDQTWLLDLVFTRDHRLLALLTVDGRELEVHVRDLKSGEDLVLPGTQGVTELHAIPDRGDILVIEVGGIWRVARRHARRIVAWTTTDGYAFYAASTFLAADGELTVISPSFNTCGDSDLLETYEVLHVSTRHPGARVRRRRVMETPALRSPELGGTSLRYELVEADDKFALVARGASARGMRVRSKSSALFARAAHGYTIAMLGERVLRLEADAVIELGAWPSGAVSAYDLEPDRDGNAIIVDEQGTVWRVSRAQGRQRLM